MKRGAFTAPPVLGRADAALVAAWVQGWAAARELAPPRTLAGGFHVHVGAPDQTSRYVFPSIDGERLRAFAAGINEPLVFLKVFTSVETLAVFLPAPWIARDPRTMMQMELAPDPVPPTPSGYTLSRQTRRGVVTLSITDTDGALAARGALAVQGHYAIFDRIRTEDAHRRRGLGRIIMRALTAEAMKQEAPQGVLVATADGHALYSSLGWRDYSPYASAVIEAPNQGA